MSEAKRYTMWQDGSCSGPQDEGDWVTSEDYDAAQSELAIWKTKACEAAEREAALREELAKVTEQSEWRREMAESNCKQHDAQVAVSHELQQRLTAAERRNSELESRLRHFASCADVRRVGTLAMDFVEGLAKPTESGASE